MSGKIARKMIQERQENSPPTAISKNENVPSASQSPEPVAKVAKVVASEGFTPLKRFP